MGIAWDASTMTTGVASIDDQHKFLIGQLNDLLTAMAAGRGRDQVEPVLGALKKYVSTHFGHEEDCMRRYNCPVAAQNASAHKQFVAKLAEIDAQFRASGPSAALTIRMQRELADWLAGHIKGTDTTLRGCVKAA